MFDTSQQLDRNGRILELDVPRVMGSANVIPYSFSDGADANEAPLATFFGVRGLSSRRFSYVAPPGALHDTRAGRLRGAA